MFCTISVRIKVSNQAMELCADLCIRPEGHEKKLKRWSIVRDKSLRLSFESGKLRLVRLIALITNDHQSNELLARALIVRKKRAAHIHLGDANHEKISFVASGKPWGWDVHSTTCENCCMFTSHSLQPRATSIFGFCEHWGHQPLLYLCWTGI